MSPGGSQIEAQRWAWRGFALVSGDGASKSAEDTMSDREFHEPPMDVVGELWRELLQLALRVHDRAAAAKGPILGPAPVRHLRSLGSSRDAPQGR